MEVLKKVKEKDLRELLIKLYKKYISEDITSDDISINTIYITVTISEGKQVTVSTDSWTLSLFNQALEAYSFGQLKVVSHVTSTINEDGNYKLQAINIACNYQIEE